MRAPRPPAAAQARESLVRVSTAPSRTLATIAPTNRMPRYVVSLNASGDWSTWINAMPPSAPIAIVREIASATASCRLSPPSLMGVGVSIFRACDGPRPRASGFRDRG